MKLSDFDYVLPPEAIAQEPCARRDGARLLVHRRDGGARPLAEHRRVSDLPALLAPGDLLVLNDTRVLPVRLIGHRPTGGRVEVLLADPVRDATRASFEALVNPARKLRTGERIALDSFFARMLERLPGPDGRPGPRWRLVLEDADGQALPSEAVLAHVERSGRMPLPPYIHRADEDPRSSADRERYQTVYAARPGAIAAPTAGLHFTPELLSDLAAGGVERTQVTLHVGLGTFQPVQAEDLSAHTMHSERYELTAAAAAAVRACRARGGRVVAVGTTAVRVLESCADEDGELHPGEGDTRLFITPGYRFRAVDALLTNFHLPKSTLLMLVSAFSGREQVLALYDEALRSAYRFYSYGDAMLLL